MSKVPCQWCNQYHDGRCPYVRAIEYHPDGTVKRVEFLTPSDCLPQQSNDSMKPPFIVTCKP